MEMSVHGFYYTSTVNEANYSRYFIRQNDYADVIMINDSIFFIYANSSQKKEAMGFVNDIGVSFGDYFTPYTTFCMVLAFAIFILLIMVSWWKLNIKLGRKGYICLIPIYNVICLADDVFHKKIVGLLFLIPFIQVIMILLLTIKLLEKYQKSTSFIILAIFFTTVVLAMIALDK